MIHRVRQLLRRGIAVFRPLFQHPAQNLQHLAGDAGAEILDREGLFRLVADELLHVRPAGERRLAREQVVEGAAEAVNIGPDVHLAGVAGLFRGDEIRRSEEGARPCQRGVAAALLVFVRVGQPGQPHVENLDRAPRLAEFPGRAALLLPFAVADCHQGGPGQPHGGIAGRGASEGPLGDEDVRGLDVPVDQTHFVGVLEADGRLANVFAGLPDAHRPVRADHLLEGLPLDVFHRDVVRAVRLVRVKEDHEVRMVQLGDGPRLAVEAGQDFRPGGQHLRADDLEGDTTVELRLDGLEHHAHAPLADGKLEPVRADDELFAVAGKELGLLISGDPIALHQLGA